MTIKRGYLCSVCGVDCSGANHRFCAWQYANTLTIRRWQYALETERLNDEDTLHLCGQRCAHKLMDKFLESREQGIGNREQEKPEEEAGEAVNQ